MECENCGHEMHYVLTDENGSHYECANCDHTYCDDSQKPENTED